jgi:flagellar hook capping protein FlgD/Big-like domain-containing protein
MVLAAPPVAAQYMYLDSNGDGLHLGDDRVNGSGPTTIDVWIDTDSNRDGSPGSCDFGTGILDFSSYEFVLQSVGGTMTWGSMTNRMPTFFKNLARDSRDTTGTVFYHNGYGETSGQPPGLYRVATLTVTVATGNPRIDIITRHNINRTGRTSFGSDCLANPERDHMNRFGVNWIDADGLASPTDVAPIVTAPGIALPTDGSQVQFTVTANDPDPGDALQSLAANLSVLPPGHNATFAVNGSFTSGTFTWTPTASDSGDYAVTFAAANVLTGRHQTIVHVVGTPTGVEPTAAPGVTRLEQNRPNPFRPGTEIPYRLAAEGTARLAVYDPNGRLVRVISSGRESAGPHVARWDGRDARGRTVASGIYLLRLEAEGARLTRRMLLLR